MKTDLRTARAVCISQAVVMASPPLPPQVPVPAYATPPALPLPPLLAVVAAAPPPPTTAKKAHGKRDNSKTARKSGQKIMRTADVLTSTTVRSPRSRPTDVADEAKAILLCHFQKYNPEQANAERVAEVITQFQLARNFRRDWAEIMYTTLMHEDGEDPRTVWADVQATLAASEAQEEDLLLLQSAAERMHPLVEEP